MPMVTNGDKMNLVARRCTRSIVEMLLTDCGAQT